MFSMLDLPESNCAFLLSLVALFTHRPYLITFASSFTILPGQGGNPAPYKKLTWDSFGVATSTPALGNFRFQFPPQCAVTDFKTKLIHGKLLAITTMYPDPKVQSFDLDAFYCLHGWHNRQSEFTQ